MFLPGVARKRQAVGRGIAAHEPRSILCRRVPRVRVLLLLHSLTLSGAPKVALDAFEELREETDLRIVALEGGPREARCRELGPLYVVPPWAKGPGRIRSALRAPFRIATSRAIRAWRPDVIYVNSVSSLPIAWHLDLPRVPVLLHVHELRSFLCTWARDDPERFLEWPDRYIACSEAVRNALVSDCGIADERMVVIHEFVPEREPRPAAAPRADDGRLVVGGAGFPVWIKGSSLWVEMAAELTKLLGRDRVSFIWVGVAPGDHCWQFEEMARKLGIHSLIEFVPLTQDPLSQFARFDVFALTSWEDPCPLVVLENMMLEKPVVCFAGSGGAPEEVGDTGVVVEDFSPRQMAEAIAELSGSADRRRALGRAARERALRLFTSAVQTPKILAEIRSLAGKGPGDDDAG